MIVSRVCVVVLPSDLFKGSKSWCLVYVFVLLVSFLFYVCVACLCVLV